MLLTLILTTDGIDILANQRKPYPTPEVSASQVEKQNLYLFHLLQYRGGS